jgi:hypothetical protein
MVFAFHRPDRCGRDWVSVYTKDCEPQVTRTDCSCRWSRPGIVTPTSRTSRGITIPGRRDYAARTECTGGVNWDLGQVTALPPIRSVSRNRSTISRRRGGFALPSASDKAPTIPPPSDPRRDRLR